MEEMFTSNFKPRSTTKAAKQVIRNEIKLYYGNGREKYYGCKTALEAMSKCANAYSARRGTSDWNKGRELVNAGCFAPYYDGQANMLGKIYGKKNVEQWPNEKIHNTYANLIGREYAAMLREKENQKQIRGK